MLTDGKHRLKINAKPYIRIENELRVGESIASGEILLDIRLNEKINTAKITLNKPKPYTDPVSYTHLDVYKRQALVSNSFLKVLKKYQRPHWLR